ncbi:hypothetical protein Clim_2135 [Chlorobium limicola DSM 245]|uniref:Uncharacterized protein n=1 Tax=Chlorobium limicola (strain DSM 245 / NBRC 103803 / 6330) TaxID=290315 RepID=B3EGP6_CHLL2|nr:hypothetical protein Clim_2135 [Chlorobium limicola DSM 245]
MHPPVRFFEPYSCNDIKELSVRKNTNKNYIALNSNHHKFFTVCPRQIKRIIRDSLWKVFKAAP